MLTLLSQVFQHALVGCCLSAFSLFFFGLASLFGWLPRLSRWLLPGLRGFLSLSVRAYDALLGALNPLVSGFGIDLRTGILRWLACVIFSSLLGLIVVLLLGWLDWIWLLAIFVLHGLLTALSWDSILGSQDLFLGEHL